MGWTQAARRLDAQRVQNPREDIWVIPSWPRQTPRYFLTLSVHTDTTELFWKPFSSGYLCLSSHTEGTADVGAGRPRNVSLGLPGGARSADTHDRITTNVKRFSVWSAFPAPSGQAAARARTLHAFTLCTRAEAPHLVLARQPTARVAR